MTVTQAVEDLVRASVGLSDAQLGRPWAWRDYDEEGLRFALLTAHHLLRDLAAALEAERSLSGPPSHAQRILAQFHDAYRDLTGVLAGAREDELDRAPAEGEWPLRTVIEHVLGAEWTFRNIIRQAIARHRRGEAPRPDTDEEIAALGERPKPTGARPDVLETLFRSHVAVLRELGDIRDDELETPSHFWESEPYPVRFRLHRFEAHLRQHTVQVETTLAGIGHSPSEAERLVRRLHVALGGVESATLGPGGAEAAERTAAAIAALAKEVAALP